nr:PREDICTED: dynein heavy chain 14, axonemal-like [Equus przewalskii]
MGKFFFGIVQSGAWCCFTDFSRPEAGVLSVVASQILAIKAAKDSYSVRFVLEGKEVRINMSCAIFATMNPGYKDRVELPDNLKSLFRPVAMMAPHYQMIAEIMLFSDHYDFGLRSMKTILIMAGKKRLEFKCNTSDNLSETDETLIIIETVREASLSKFLPEDVPLFEKIIGDVFPGATVSKVNQIALEKAIFIATGQLGLQQWPTQKEKIIQFYNQLQARVGVMLVGPTGGGKTTVRRILERTLVLLPVEDVVSIEQRESISQSPQCAPSTALVFALLPPIPADFDWQWIILDGPVDTFWVENLNSMLDDTRTLCLANSERIPLTDNIRVIFEVDSLSHASPATVSRCAMVYMDPVDLGWEPYVKSWLLKTSKIIGQSGVDCLEFMIKNSVTNGLQFIKKHQKFQPFPVQDITIIVTLCRILDAFFEFMDKKIDLEQLH